MCGGLIFKRVAGIDFGQGVMPAEKKLSDICFVSSSGKRLGRMKAFPHLFILMFVSLMPLNILSVTLGESRLGMFDIPSRRLK